MKVTKLVTALAAGALIGTAAIAAPLPTATTKVDTPSAVELTAGKKVATKKVVKKAAVKKKVVKRVVKKRPAAKKRVVVKRVARAGTCGTFMYFSRKDRKCLDARNKR